MLLPYHHAIPKCCKLPPPCNNVSQVPYWSGKPGKTHKGITISSSVKRGILDVPRLKHVAEQRRQASSAGVFGSATPAAAAEPPTNTELLDNQQVLRWLCEDVIEAASLSFNMEGILALVADVRRSYPYYILEGLLESDRGHFEDAVNKVKDDEFDLKKEENFQELGFLFKLAFEAEEGSSPYYHALPYLAIA